MYNYRVRLQSRSGESQISSKDDFKKLSVSPMQMLSKWANGRYKMGFAVQQSNYMWYVNVNFKKHKPGKKKKV